MKKIIYILTFSLFFLGCETDQKLPGGNSDSGWIQFDSESTAIQSRSDSFNIPFSIPVGVNKQGLTITYEVTAKSGNPPQSLLGTFTTKLNVSEDEGIISKKLIDNGDNYELLYTLTKSSNPDYLIGLSDGSKTIKHTVKVFKIKPSYTGDTYSEDLELPPSTYPAFKSTFTPVPDQKNMWTLDTTWGPDFVSIITGGQVPVGSFPYSSTLTLNDDFTVTVIGDDQFTPGGQGTFDPFTNTFVLNLTQELFTNDFTVDVILNN